MTDRELLRECFARFEELSRELPDSSMWWTAGDRRFQKTMNKVKDALVKTALEPAPREAKQGGHGIYVASRVSQAPMWRGLRDNGNVPIVSTWIDEAGDGETADFGELWTRIQREIAGSSGLVFWADVNDAPWKGALIEIGIALALGKPVGVVLLGELEGRTMRPVGSWIHHPNVRVTRFLDEAIDHASACRYVGEGPK